MSQLSHFLFSLGIKQVDECGRKISKLKAMGIPTKNLKLIEVDQKSLKSVTKFAEAVHERAIRIDILICNGITKIRYTFSILRKQKN